MMRFVRSVDRALTRMITDTRLLILVIVLIPLILFLSRSPVQEHAYDERNAIVLDSSTARIENEDKLVIPLERTEEVWSYLHKAYVEDAEHLRSLDPAFSSYYNDEFFTDTYFDTPDLQMLARQSGVRHRQRVNLTDPDHTKSGRELMQIKLNDISNNELNRGELKFDIEHPERIRRADDAHPMIGIVQPSEREAFKETLVTLGLNPYAMRPIVTIEQRRRRIYILRDNEPFMSLSLDEVSSHKLWVTARFTELEPELNEIGYTEADEATRKYMEDISAKIGAETQQAFPYIKRDLTPKYNKVFAYFESKIPLLRFFIEHFDL